MKIDVRKLSTEIQQQIRHTAIELRKKGSTYVEISEILEVYFSAIGKWCRLYNKGGYDGLKIKRRGVRNGATLKLTLEQYKLLENIMIDKTPDQLKLPFYLWTRKAIKAAFCILWEIDIPLRTTSEYMKRSGFSPQKPLKKAYE